MSLRILIVAAMVMSRTVQVAASEPGGDPPKSKSIAVKLVDQEGKPVAGAEIGTMAATGAYIAQRAAKEGTEWLFVNHVRSDADGMVEVGDAENWLGHLCLVARHEGRKLAAVANVDPKNAKETVVMTLRPERRLAGGVTCPELDERERAIKRIVVYVMFEGKRALECMFEGSSFEIPLPPGDYSLDIYGGETHSTNKEVKLTPGNDPQRIEPIRLRATRLALLEGQPAPEIPGVIAWKNSPPLKLADLRGKCVLLDFWGYWCGPCIYQMPKAFELYDKYHSQGLEIIGVHTDLGEDEQTPVATVEELDKRLTPTRKELWKDRDLPFPVALVVGKRTSYGDGNDQLARSAAAAEWGIKAYPTHVLIDRQGKIVGQIAPTDEGIKLLEQKLAER